MIRRGLLFAISALIVPLLLLSVWPVLRAAAADPRLLIRRGIVEFVLALVSPVTLLLFLVALYQELTGSASARRRQNWALAAAFGMAVRIGFEAGELHATSVSLRSLPPEARAQFSPAAFDLSGQWVHAIFWNFLPALIWAGFLLIFWLAVAPLGRKWTRGLALVLCLFAIPPVLTGLRGVRFGIHQYLAYWRARGGALPATPPPALTLAVRPIAPCGSLEAGAPMPLSGTAKSYCFKEPTIVDERDIGWAELGQRDQSAVWLTLSSDGARRLRPVTGQIGAVINGRLVSVSARLALPNHVLIPGLTRDVTDRMVASFPRLHPMWPFQNPAISFWSLLILPIVLLAAATGLPYFLFCVWWTRSAPYTAPATAEV